MSYERITRYDSPNFTPRAKVFSVFGVSRNITSIAIHHWGDPRANATFAGVIAWLCRKNGKSSAHSVIEAGRVAYLINYSDASWSTGNSRGNATTIGLELHPRASKADYDTVAEHVADIWLEYGYLPLRPHSYWKATACPGRWDLNKIKKLAEVYYQKKRGAPQPKPKKKVEVPYHTVVKGDTLYKIARDNGTSVIKLLSLNDIGSGRIISIGQKIRLK